MKLLLLLPYIPYPLDSGGNQGVFNMLAAIEKEHSVTVVLRGDETPDTQKLRELLPDMEFILYPYHTRKDENPYAGFGIKSRKFSFVRYVANSFRRKYLREYYRHREDDAFTGAFSRRNSQMAVIDRQFNPDESFGLFVEKLCLERHFDAVQAEFAAYLPTIYYLPKDVVKIFVHHEILFVRLENEISLFPDKGPRDYAELEKYRDWELSMLRRFNHVIALTETDRKLLTPLLPGVTVHSSPAVIKQRPPLPFAPARKELVFLGAYLHYPNADGLIWFTKSVLPIIRKRIPDVKVNVIGTWNDSLKGQLQKEAPELVFLGRVNEVQPILNGKVSIIPIRIGSGMRMKMLDAVSAHSPVVTTSKGIEGQAFIHDKDCLIADSPEDFASCTVRLLEDEELQRKLSSSAGETLSSLYSPDEMIQRRLSIYREIEKTLQDL